MRPRTPSDKFIALLVLGRPPGDRLLDKFRNQSGGRVIENDREIMIGSFAALKMGVAVGDAYELFGDSFEVV